MDLVSYKETYEREVFEKLKGLDANDKIEWLKEHLEQTTLQISEIKAKLRQNIEELEAEERLVKEKVKLLKANRDTRWVLAMLLGKIDEDVRKAHVDLVKEQIDKKSEDIDQMHEEMLLKCHDLEEIQPKWEKVEMKRVVLKGILENLQDPATHDKIVVHHASEETDTMAPSGEDSQQGQDGVMVDENNNDHSE